MDKKNNELAKLYFIRSLKKFITNEYKILAKKYYPSIQQLLMNYIILHNEIKEHKEISKLEKSRNDLVDSIKFFLKDCIYKKTDYVWEIQSLQRLIEGEKVNYESLSKACAAFLKKISESNIYEKISNIVLETEIFEEIDQIIDIFIKELLYDGYSLCYIDEWYNEQYKANTKDGDLNIDGFIKAIKSLKHKNKELHYYLTFDNDENLESTFFIASGVKIQRASEDELPDKYRSYLQTTGENRVFKITIKAKDAYKGGETIQKLIESYLLIINKINNNHSQLRMKYVVKYDNGEFLKLTKKQSDSMLFLITDSREKYDLFDFKEYRSRVFSAEIKTDGISTIERVFNILQSHKTQTSEMQLINLWSAMEYLLSYLEDVSIITKAKNIIPKLMCLYCFKDKINIYWSNIRRAIHFNKEARKIFDYCKDSNDQEKYNLNKVLEYIKIHEESSAEKLSEQGGIVLKRMYLEIGNYLYNPRCERVQLVKKQHDVISNDIISIYRSRNILVHSGISTVDSIDLKVVRLQQYISNLLGVIVHFKRKNPLFTISEILNSIVVTYEEYCSRINEEITDVCYLVKPTYVFLSN